MYGVDTSIVDLLLMESGQTDKADEMAGIVFADRKCSTTSGAPSC